MSFIKLPSNSEKILLELAQAENPTQVLCAHYDSVSEQERRELDGIVEELTEYGYIRAIWADGMPWIVTLKNSARTYGEQLAEYETQKAASMPQETKVKSIIFISHRSTDKAIADMLVDFFSGTGIPRDAVFCSILPGNDINEKISSEVKRALEYSTINIAILSQDYYQSAYCLNEAGILWYKDTPVIPIGLPEINPSNMYGFLNNEYKLRRLNSEDDISYIYDAVRDAVDAPQTKFGVVTYESNKLRDRYTNFIKTRNELTQAPVSSSPIAESEITTDDERIILYYILLKNVRKVTKGAIVEWLRENEIYDVNVDNAFDLLSSFDGSSVNDDTLELGIDEFRKYSTNASTILSDLKKHVDQHIKLAADTFKSIWNPNTLDSTIMLFLAYIVDERIRLLGAGWMEDEQLKSIIQWESQNALDSTLSSNYSGCLKFFIQNDLVYESDWTRYGNPRKYTLHSSLRKLLFNCPADIIEELQKIKSIHDRSLPF